MARTAIASATIGIVPTGAANIASVCAAIERAGGHPMLVSDPNTIRSSEAIILPGVGAFAQAMEALGASGFVEPLRDRIALGRPTLCICLGLQLLCTESEESPGVTGLGVITDTVTRFESETLAVPQLGWNRITADPGCEALESGAVYFANSYRLVRCPSGWHAAMSDYGGPFVAGLERDRVVACQFHPELSGRAGARMIGRWLERIGEGVPC